ncbi:hypothetical protein GALMADRAFT_151449 [Galerina marginata CBS 339.88]|uniref:Aldehyde dehydrogenase domain-containing protein n=1 Tax=Galerina marginata (strain CBS 339.88) TaxID=685588 RepID=A0A067TXE5_GALM3|nr:hypothetical protein GALMADRAFT_151449 [Galerina marginata CBS 339.88]
MVQFEERLFIAGQFVEGSGEKIDVINPATKEKIASVHAAGAKEVDLAVDAAEKAWPAWADGDPSVRTKALFKLSELIEANGEELKLAQTMEMGKSITESGYDIAASAGMFRYFAGYADKISGKTSAMPGFLGMEIRQPYGVTAGITPWNAPLVMVTMKVGPALAAGNASIIKTSEKSPLAALIVARLAKEAGVPDGILSILSGGRETGQIIASHMKIRKISFTGSTLAGKSVAQAAARSNLKACTLELGGKSPVVVFDDCDLEDAVAKIQLGFNVTSGQVCIANTRIYVQDTIFDKFGQKLVESLEKMQVGDPLDGSSFSGPLVDDIQFKNVSKYLDIGKKEGKVLIGGVTGDEKGYFVKPTIFVDVNDDAVINREEIFGPVTILHKFTSEDEVLKRANDTEYGLSAYVFTKDVTRAIKFAKRMEAGVVGVNVTLMANNNLAFGGWKGSGLGRELGQHGVESYTQVKTIFMR